MIKQIYLISLVFLLSCQSKQEGITDLCQLGDLNLTLVQEGEIAKLKIGESTRTIKGKLELKPPCYFLRLKGEVQTYAYPDVEASQVLIIIGNLSDDEMKDKFGVPRKEVCGNKIQGLILKKDSIIFSSKTLSGGVTCKDSGSDEKNFWDFAH